MDRYFILRVWSVLEKTHVMSFRGLTGELSSSFAKNSLIEMPYLLSDIEEIDPKETTLVASVRIKGGTALALIKTDPFKRDFSISCVRRSKGLHNTGALLSLSNTLLAYAVGTTFEILDVTGGTKIDTVKESEDSGEVIVTM